MLDEPSKIPNLSFFQKAKNKNKSVSQNRINMQNGCYFGIIQLEAQPTVG
jgi:hypothetical protein